MMEIRLLIKSPDIWVRDVMRLGMAGLRFQDCMPWGRRGGRGLLRFEGSREDAVKLVERIRAHPDIEKVETSTLKDGGLLLTVTTKNCYVCRALTSSDCFLISSFTTEEGDLLWTIITPSEESVRRLVKGIEAKGTSVKFLSIVPLDHKEVLTRKQLDVIRTAFELGYYDMPKRTGIVRLAKRFKVSPSTLAEILQRGEKKVIGLFLKARP